MAVKNEYEALVKLEDNINPSLPPHKQGALWKADEIVVVRPKGWVWGRMEVKRFAIVYLGFLTKEEAEAYEEEVTIDTEEIDGEGNPQIQKEFVARRRYKIDIKGLFGTYNFLSTVSCSLPSLKCILLYRENTPVCRTYIFGKRAFWF